MALHDEVVLRHASELHPDPTNPRLPSSVWNGSESDLFVYMERYYDAVSLAESLASFGFFPSEPLVVVPEGGEYRVVEGNRRLTAIKGLSDADLRAQFRNPARWDELAREAEDRFSPASIPTVLADSWEDAAALIGNRHVAGIQRWDAYPKARFVARLIDNEGKTAEEAADLVGEGVAAVKSLYRNFHILEQARAWDLNGVAAAEGRFGIFTAALNRRALRSFVGAPAPAEVIAGQPPIENEFRGPLSNLLSWLYGDDTHDPVIDESRDLRTLAAVVESRPGLLELQASRNLELADVAAGGPRLRLDRQLERAVASLEAALRHVNETDQLDDFDFEDALARCEAAIGEIRRALEREPGAA
jgi:hypothetical protein